MLSGLLTPSIVVIFVLLFTGTISACTCIDYGVPACKLFGNADAVFIGKVDRITPANEAGAEVPLSGVGSISSRGVDIVSVQFSVENAFKGVAGKSVRAMTYSGTSCDVGVDEGEQWVIFANKDPKSGVLGFGACSGSGRVDADDKISRTLKQLSDPANPGSIQGRISLNRYEAIKGATVSVIGQGRKLTAKTDENGRYYFDLPKPGKYTVKISVPFSMGVMFPSGNLPAQFKAREPTEADSTFRYTATAEPAACSYQSFDGFKIDLKATASISGKFTSFDARLTREPFPEICQLKSTEKETLDSCEHLYPSVEPNGNFSFEELREGRYTIVVGQNFPTGLEPFKRHYYPGVSDFSQAKAIEIRQSEKKVGLQFTLPPTLLTRIIRGQIVASDGSPARLREGDARFFYFSAYNFQTGRDPDLLVSHSYRLNWGEGKKGPEIEMFKTSPDGTFEAELFEGFTYILRVESGQEFNGHQCGFALINVGPNLKEPVRIVLDRERPCDVKEFANRLGIGLKQ